MNDALLSLARQRGKNITLLVVCGTLVALVHADAAVAVMSAVAVAVGAPAVAETWVGAGGASTGETK